MEICGGENCSHFGELSQGQLELCHGDGLSLGCLQYSDNHKLCQCWLQSFWSSLDLLLSYANVISALFRFQFSGNSDNSCMYSLRTGSFSLVLQFQSVMHRYRRCDEIEEHVVATKWIHYKSHLLWQWQANKRSKASEQNKSLKKRALGVGILHYLKLFLLCSTYQNKAPMRLPSVITDIRKEKNNNNLNMSLNIYS